MKYLFSSTCLLLPGPSQACCTGAKALLKGGARKGHYSLHTLHTSRGIQIQAQMASGDSWLLS